MKIAKIPPVNPEHFRLCFFCSAAAMEGRDPQFKFDGSPFRVKIGEEGPVETVAFVDHPLNRLMQSVRSQCKNSAEFKATATRLLALGELIPKLPASLMRAGGETGFLLHESVLELAAKFPVNEDLQFDSRAFIGELMRHPTVYEIVKSLDREILHLSEQGFNVTLLRRAAVLLMKWHNMQQDNMQHDVSYSSNFENKKGGDET